MILDESRVRIVFHLDVDEAQFDKVLDAVESFGARRYFSG